MAEQQNEQGGVENQEMQPEGTTPNENTVEASEPTTAPAIAAEAESNTEETATEERSIFAKLTDAAGALAHQVQEVVGDVVGEVKDKVADLLPHSETQPEATTETTAEETTEATSEETTEATSEETTEPTSEETTEPTSEETSEDSAEATSEETSEDSAEATSEDSADATAEAATEGTADESSAEGADDKAKRKRSKKGGSGGGRKGRKLETFTVNEEIQGTVRSVQPYGAFVDVGAERDGLIHISELRDGFVEKVGDVVKEGDPVTVRVKEVDSEKGRLSLTMRSAQAMEKDRQQQDDRDSRVRLRDLKEGQELTGKVTSIVDFGAFVDIGATTDGLVHISELSEERINKVTDVVQEGLEVTVRVLSIDKKRNRISLTMRQHVAEDEYTYEEDEEQGTLPSVMEVAFARARERSKKDKKGKKGKQDEQGKDVMDDIIARTLGQHGS